MDFALTEEQKQIKALIKDYFQRERLDFPQLRGSDSQALLWKDIAEFRAYADANRAAEDKLFQAGLAQLAVPEKYGGGGLASDLLTMVLAAEEAGYRAEGVGAGMGGPWLDTSSIALAATEEQRDWFFPKFMEKHVKMGTAASEPTGTTDSHFPYDEGGSTVLKTFAYKDGNEWVINGQKMWGTGLAVADLIRVAARTDKEAPISEAMTFFWVPKDAPGLTIIPNRMLGTFSNCQSFYDNVRVPEENMLGRLNEGSKYLQIFLSQAPVMWAGGIGWTQRLYEQLREFTKERVQGGKPLIKHSVVRTMLGEIATDMEATRSLLYRAAWETTKARQAGLPTNMYWSSIIAFQVKNMWLRVAAMASDIWGGLSAPVDMPLHDYWQTALHHSHGGGTRNVMAMKAADEYEERYTGQLWETV